MSDNAETRTGTPYPEVTPTPDFPKLEEEILAYWKENRIFERSVEARSPRKEGANNEFVFYDGPPFANGLPHYGHLVTSYVKDIVPRYQTMRGLRAERRFGWDCHGLPAELQTEKELEISGRHQITEYGIKKFNDACHASVLRFTDEWRYYVERMARWVDFENDYKTLDKSYMESVMWAFKTLWDKGLVYEDYRVVPYSWAVETPLSNFETRMDNSYRMRQDPTVTAAFRLNPDSEKAPWEAGKNAYLLAWTTMPWTFPSNVAIAVGPEIEYAVLEKDGELLILAEACRENYKKELEGAAHLKTLKGSDLAGRTYEPLFPFFKDTPNAFVVLAEDFVETGEGTAIVHLTSAFGEEDFYATRSVGIPVVVPVDSKGRFTSEVPPYEGMMVFDANKQVIRDLKQMGRVLRQETIDHNYPHCWRTDEPLIYKAINSWYLKVTAFKDRMVELNREQINWIPSHVRDGQFGRWLENARDWNIARNRFWGAPIPVWRSDNPDHPRIDVYGSIEELERDFGVTIENLHRPEIDDLVRPNPDDPSGQSMMRRVEDVLDCWFESGSMPFAQVHYPFENKEWFESHFPGDFIVEYIAQTRGWFYTLMVLSTALFDSAPFRNCICHGVVLDENHQKLSKRLRNYPDPVDVFNTYGADALRWFMVSTPLMQGGDLSMPRDGKAIGQTRNQIINPVWNAYSFFTLYANADGIRGRITREAGENVLDRYILAKTRALRDEVTERMDGYDIPGACQAIGGFLDALTNWYIRRSRERFWRAAQDGDKRAAYDTLYTVLTGLCRIAAPFLPFVTEAIYRGLGAEAESVHLADWPEADEFPADSALVKAMDRVRETCSAALSVREANNLRIRLPLSEMIVASGDAEQLAPFTELIRDELNVKKVTLSTELARYGTLELKVNPQIGRRLKDKMKPVMEAARTGNWQDNGDGTVTAAGEVLGPEDFSMRLAVGEGLDASPLSGQGAVILDTKLTPELEKEGLARDLVRLIQSARKDAGLDISDRITLKLVLPADAAEAARAHESFIRGETLAERIEYAAPAGTDFVSEQPLHGQTAKIGLSRTAVAA